MKIVVCFFGAVVLAAAAANGADDLARDSASLKQLLGEIQKVLSEGWRAEITPDVPTGGIFDQVRRSDAPCLTIWHLQEELGVYSMPSPPMRSENSEADYKPTLLYFQLTLMDFLTPQQYREVAEKNADGNLRRIEF